MFISYNMLEVNKFRILGNFKKNRYQIGINTRNWVDSAQGRDYWKVLENTILNLRVPYAMELVKWDQCRPAL